MMAGLGKYDWLKAKSTGGSCGVAVDTLFPKLVSAVREYTTMELVRRLALTGTRTNLAEAVAPAGNSLKRQLRMPPWRIASP